MSNQFHACSVTVQTLKSIHHHHKKIKQIDLQKIHHRQSSHICVYLRVPPPSWAMSNPGTIRHPSYVAPNPGGIGVLMTKSNPQTFGPSLRQMEEEEDQARVGPARRTAAQLVRRHAAAARTASSRSTRSKGSQPWQPKPAASLARRESVRPCPSALRE